MSSWHENGNWRRVLGSSYQRINHGITDWFGLGVTFRTLQFQAHRQAGTPSTGSHLCPSKCWHWLKKSFLSPFLLCALHPSTGSHQGWGIPRLGHLIPSHAGRRGGSEAPGGSGVAFCSQNPKQGGTQVHPAVPVAVSFHPGCASLSINYGQRWNSCLSSFMKK